MQIPTPTCVNSKSFSLMSTGLTFASITLRNNVAVFDEPAGRLARSPVASRGIDLITRWLQSFGRLLLDSQAGFEVNKLRLAKPDQLRGD